MGSNYSSEKWSIPGADSVLFREDAVDLPNCMDGEQTLDSSTALEKSWQTFSWPSNAVASG